MRKLLFWFVITGVILSGPLSTVGAAQEPEPEEPAVEDSENDPNLAERLLECATRPLGLRELCVASASVSEAGQEAVDLAVAGANSAWIAFVASFVASATAFTYEVSNWWITQPSQVQNASLVETFQNQFAWLAGFMVVGGIIWQGTRLMILRKPDGLAETASALFKFVVISAGGYTIVTQLSAATDEWAGSVVAENAAEIETGALGDLVTQNPNLAFILAIFLIIGGIMQTILFVLRDLSLLVMTGFLIFAASGQFFQFSRGWLGRVIGPILAILFYKPMAAIIMNIALGLLATGNTYGYVAGTAMVFLSAFAIKPFMKIFAVFTPEGMTPFGSGGGLGLGGAAMGAGALALGSRGGSSGGGSGGDVATPQAAKLVSTATETTGTATAGTTSGTAAAGTTSGAAAAAGPAVVGVIAAQKGAEVTKAAGAEMGDRMSGGT